jgi:nucleotide-binding universal stress UspA family protein
MKVLLAVDGSDYTKCMLAFTAAHDEFLRAGTRYTALTVVQKVPPRAAAYFNMTDLEGYYAEQARAVLDPVRAFVSRKGWSVDFRHAVGPVSQEIATVAQRERFDMVVLGSHGHGALVGLVLGSVVTGVLARCTVPVLIVRRPDSEV